MSFTCPHCNKTSHNPADEREAYCSVCHHYCRDVAIDELHGHLGEGELYPEEWNMEPRKRREEKKQ